jgi:voltage-gated potassium channel Kch
LALLLLVIAMAVRIARAKLGVGFVLQLITLGALIYSRRHFTRRTTMASVVFSLTNILAIKELNPSVPVVAVASSALSIRRLKLAHADVVFSPAGVGSRLLADLVQGGQILPEFRDLLEGHIKQT